MARVSSIKKSHPWWIQILSKKKILGENIKSSRKPLWHVARPKPALPKNLRDLTSGDKLDDQLILSSDQKKKLSKYSRSLVGLLTGHEWILVVLPVLRRFVASNVTIIRNVQGVDQPGASPPRSPIGRTVPGIPSSQSNRPQIKIPEPSKTKKSRSGGAIVGFAGVAAFIGLFFVLNQSDGSSSSVTPVQSWESLSRSIVYIESKNASEAWSGSGTLIIDGSYVLTNFHVTPGFDNSYSVFLTESFDDPPDEVYTAQFVIGDEYNDLAIIQIVDDDGNPVIIRDRTIIEPSLVDPNLGEKLTNIGYPSVGFGDAEVTVTITSGGYSGKLELNSDNFNGEYFKTDGMLSFGVSGGATFNSKFEFIGVPSGGTTDDDSSAAIGYIKPARHAADLIAKVQK